MAKFTDTFQRIETKFRLREDQYKELRKRLEGMAEVDEYGETSILNIYFDTPSWQLVRTSLDGPVYKEKLRLRSYGVATDTSPAFIEIKKKYKGIVYKRRISMSYADALDYLIKGNPVKNKSQISGELDAFISYYKDLRPAMTVSYDRIAMAGIDDSGLRITFDRNIRYRTEDLDLKRGNTGKDILRPGERLMELKIAGAMPLELARIFSELGIYRTSFSKYGKGYEDYMHGGVRSANISACSGALVTAIA